MDVWGPARVRGQGQERYFLIVVDDYSCYTTVFPLRTKGAAAVDPLPHQGAAPSSVSHVDPVEPVEVAVNSCPVRGAERERTEPGVAETGDAEPRGAEFRGTEPGGAESGGAEPGSTEPACAESGAPSVADPATGAADPGVGPAAGAVDPGVGAAAGATHPGVGAAAGAADPGVGAGASAADQGVGATAGAADPGVGVTTSAADTGIGAAAGAADPGVGGAGGAAGAGGGSGAVSAAASRRRPRSHSYRLPRHFLVILPTLVLQAISQSVLSLSLTFPLFLLLLTLRLLATAVTDPSFESAAASALVAELVDFAARRRLDYAAILIAESDSGDPDAPHIPTPRSYAEAIKGPYSSQWQPAMDAEMASWKSTGTYVDEREGVDFFQTFSPTPKMTTLRVLLHVAAQRDYELHSLDFSTAFLQGSLHKEIGLRRPPGFTGSFPPGTQWSLRRPVYGLRQAPREWHDTLRTTLAALGFSPSTADPSPFLRTDTSLPPFYILLYVDDLVFATADTESLAHVKSELQKRHTCTDLGELRSYLGLQITQDRARRIITLTQSHMVQQVLQHFGFT
ncbi:unnamed protein product [Closterium sp. NIES-64]|nr:unnamed protein product [Closterium sp. NIES-64]